MKTTANAVSLAQRPDLARIASWIEPSTHVLDLGCADGKLLAYLQRTKNVQGTGIERDPQAVVASVRRGVPVIQQDRSEERRVGKEGRGGWAPCPDERSGLR